MVKKKTEDEVTSQAAITDAAVKHQEEYGAQPEAPAPYFAPNVAELPKMINWEDQPLEIRAEAFLSNARQLLEHIGHFETNQALVSIDAALEWLKKCEGQRT